MPSSNRGPGPEERGHRNAEEEIRRPSRVALHAPRSMQVIISLFPSFHVRLWLDVEPNGFTVVAPPHRFVGQNPPTRRPKPMSGVPKGILLAYSAKAAASAGKAGHLGYGGYPQSSPPLWAGLSPLRGEG